MATSFLTPLQMNKLEILQPRLQQATTGAAPSTPVTGQIYYATDTNTPYCWNGSAWQSMFGASPTYAAPSFTFGTSNAAGAASTGIRSDASIALFDVTVPTTSAVADAAAVGVASVAARRDHTHGREAFGGAPANLAASASAGTALTVPHSDHVHQHTHTDHNAIVLNDLASATANYSMGANKLTGLALATAGTDAASLANKISDFATPGVDVAWGSHKITALLDPTSAQDAATKNYVDNTAQGLSPKQSAQAATTGAETFTIAAGSVTGINGTTVDGISIAVGGYVLVKDAPAASGSGSANSTQPGNGLYTCTANTTNLTLVRATDMDDANDPPQGAFVFVEAGGTNNASTGWVVSVPAAGAAFTYGTNNIHWVQFSGAGTYLGTANQITLTGNTFSIATAYVGQASITTLGTITTGVWTGTAIAVANGGTGATTAATARNSTNLGSQTAPAGGGSLGVVSVTARGIPTKVSAVLGDGAATTCTVNHNLGTRDVAVLVYRATSPWDQVIPDVQMLDTNNVNLIFAVAPTASQYACTVVG